MISAHWSGESRPRPLTPLPELVASHLGLRVVRDALPGRAPSPSTRAARCSGAALPDMSGRCAPAQFVGCSRVHRSSAPEAAVLGGGTERQGGENEHLQAMAARYVL